MQTGRENSPDVFVPNRVKGIFHYILYDLLWILKTPTHKDLNWAEGGTFWLKPA